MISHPSPTRAALASARPLSSPPPELPAPPAPTPPPAASDTAAAGTARASLKRPRDPRESEAPGPLVPRAVPLTQRGGRVAPPDARLGLPRSLLALVAAYASEDQPLSYFRSLCDTLGRGSALSDTSLFALVSHRPEAMLEIHPMLRTREDYLRYFMAGGTLRAIPKEERDETVCQMAVALDFKALIDVPTRWRCTAMCQAVVRRDGWMLGSVPPELLAAESPARVALCDAAFDSGHPPRVRHVPKDLLTEERCIAALRRMPLDLAEVPLELVTEAMCVEAIRATPAGIQPCYRGIPEALRGHAVARAILARRTGQGELFPLPNWYAPEARSPEVLMRFLQSDHDTAPEGRRVVAKALVAAGQMTLPLFAELLKIDPDAFESVPSLPLLVNAMSAAIQAAGLEPGGPLQGPGWPSDLLPRDTSAAQVWRWASRLLPHDWQSLPLELRSDEAVCREGLQLRFQNIQHVPPATLQAHPGLIEAAVQAEPDRRGASWSQAPRDCTLTLLPPEVCAAMDRERLVDLCRTSVGKSGWVLGPLLQRVGHLLPAESVAELSIVAADRGCDWRDIPETHQAHLRIAALEHHGGNLAHMDPAACTPEWCVAALNHTIKAWAHVPARFKTPALLSRVRFSRDSLKGLPPLKDLPAEFIARIRREFGASPALTPSGQWTPELLTASILANPSIMPLMRHVPDHLRAPVYREVLKARPDLIYRADKSIELTWPVYACVMGANPVDVARWVSRHDVRNVLPGFMANLESFQVLGLVFGDDSHGRAIAPAASS